MFNLQNDKGKPPERAGYHDGRHIPKTVGYLVAERGSDQLKNGAWLKADEIPAGEGKSWQFGSYLAPFETSPVVISTLAACYDASPVVTRLKEIEPTGFELMMEADKANGAARLAHATDRVGYVAWEAFCGEINGLQFAVGKTADPVTHRPAELGFLDHCGDPAISYKAQSVLLGTAAE